jgi:hypothetical protein
MLPYLDNDVELFALNTIESAIRPLCTSWQQLLLPMLVVMWLFKLLSSEALFMPLLLLKLLFDWLFVALASNIKLDVSSSVLSLCCGERDLGLALLAFWWLLDGFVDVDVVVGGVGVVVMRRRVDSFVSSSSFGSFSMSGWCADVVELSGVLSSESESDPPGITRRLHTGHKRLLRNNHLSMHSTW